MKPVLAALAIFFGAAIVLAEGSSGERLRYNTRERTLRGIAALQDGDVERAVEHLETASRLDQDSPVTAFNAATAKLIAGHEDAAVRLEEAAALAPPELQPAIQYNLGNARLAGQDPAAAIDAYKQTLRLDPGHMEAKFNLELAQRLLEEQQKQQEQEQQSQPSDQQQKQQEQPEQQPGEQEEKEEQSGEQQEEKEEQPGEQQEQEQEPDQGESGENEPQKRPLPDFEDQEDMTAEQAAAILEAVEGLEREQRRKQAEERARRRARTGKDW